MWRCSISIQVSLHRNIKEVTSLVVKMIRKVTLVIQLVRRESFRATIHIVANPLNLVLQEGVLQSIRLFLSLV
jgi:hypothetical protein